MPDPESTTQMRLAKDGGVLNRLPYLMVQQARTVKAEADGTTHHVGRAAYAHLITSGSAGLVSSAAVMVVGGVNLLPPNATTTVNQDGTVTTDATDAALLSQIATFWNDLAITDP